MATLEEDFPKIKQVSDTEIDATINYLLVLLNVQISTQSQKERDLQILVLTDFLKDRFANLTLEEVRQAFRMYVAKEFPDLKTFRTLDSISLGEVLKSYTDFKSESLRIYSHKKSIERQKEYDFNPSNKEKQSLLYKHLENIFEALKTQKTDYSAFIYFEKLKSKIKLSSEEKIRLYNYEEQKYLQELKEESRNDFNKRSLYKKIIEEFKARESNEKPLKYDPLIIQKCKASMVCNYLRNKDLNTIFKELC